MTVLYLGGNWFLTILAGKALRVGVGTVCWYTGVWTWGTTIDWVETGAGVRTGTGTAKDALTTVVGEQGQFGLEQYL